MTDLLLVDDDPGTIELLRNIVEHEGRVRFALTGGDGLRLARESTPSLLLLDAGLPDMSGFELCSELKAEPQFANVPVVFVSAHGDEEFELAGFRVGGSDFIIKPLKPQLVLERVRAQLRNQRMSEQLRSLAARDELTGIANRRRLEEVLAHEWRRSRRSLAPLSFGLVDVDHFKKYNDRYGHRAGDVCLRAVAEALCRACRRPADLVARYGGEEFAVLLPETPWQGAELVAQRIIDAMEELALPHEASTTSCFVSVSVGMASFSEAMLDFGTSNAGGVTEVQLIDAADSALYSAKRSGRARAHRVRVVGGLAEPPAPLRPRFHGRRGS